MKSNFHVLSYAPFNQLTNFGERFTCCSRIDKKWKKSFYVEKTAKATDKEYIYKLKFTVRTFIQCRVRLRHIYEVSRVSILFIFSLSVTETLRRKWRNQRENMSAAHMMTVSEDDEFSSFTHNTMLCIIKIFFHFAVLTFLI